jgi:NitT/TauT family transport system substrate-binding protein
MSDAKRIILGLLLWTSVVSALHLNLNFDWSVVINDRLPGNKRKFNVAYIPVTCHLACPVTDYISRRTDLGTFLSRACFRAFRRSRKR